MSHGSRIGAQSYGILFRYTRFERFAPCVTPTAWDASYVVYLVCAEVVLSLMAVVTRSGTVAVSQFTVVRAGNVGQKMQLQSPSLQKVIRYP
jgi:hypothetical protein